jgi:hypothetical protein
MDTPFANSEPITSQTNHPPAPSSTSSSDTAPCTPLSIHSAHVQVPATKESFGIHTTIVGSSPLDAQSSRTVTCDDSAGTSNGEVVPLKQRFANLFVSGRTVSREPSAKESFMAVVRSSWINVLLVFVPVSPALRSSTWRDVQTRS